MEELDITSITKRSVQGIISLISRQFILKLISFASAIIIATKLSAEEFGTYVIIITIQQIISFFTDFGLGAALVQKKGELEQHEIDTVFTIQFLVTSIIFLVVFLGRNLTKNFIYFFTKSNVSETGIWLLVALILTIFLSSFKLIPSILLERKIQHQKLVIPQIAEQFAFNIVLVILLLRGLGLASYTWAFAISSVISIPLYYLVSPWKIQFGIHNESLSHLKFGTQFQAKNILANIKDKFLKLFLGASLGSKKIGYIGFAETWSFYAYSFIVDSVVKVSFATYSRLQEEKEHVRLTIEKSLFFVSATIFPINVGMLITMPYIISFVPKWHKWEPSIISIIFLSLNATISSLSGILINVLDANGKVKTTLQLMVIWTALTWFLTIILIKYFDYNGYAIASFIVTLTIVYTIFLVKQVVQFDFLKSIYKPTLATIIMAISVIILSKVMARDMITLIFVIIMGGAIYISLMYLIAGKEIISDIKMLLIRKKNE